MQHINATIISAATLISNADALVITAGAGLGVDSGLPDFRGNEGFWKAYPALGSAGINFSSIASPGAFLRDPELAWGFYGHRLALYRETTPHAGFQLLRNWSNALRFGAWVFTSNVDGAFQKAGFSEEKINECHGSINYLQCMRGCTPEVWSAEEFKPDVDVRTCRLVNTIPVCPHCGCIARPNIVMFNDNGWLPHRHLPQRHNQQIWLQKLAKVRANIVVVELGAGTAITSVRRFGAHILVTYAGRIVRINLRDANLNGECGVSIQMGALDALMGIDTALKEMLYKSK